MSRDDKEEMYPAWKPGEVVRAEDTPHGRLQRPAKPGENLHRGYTESNVRHRGRKYRLQAFNQPRSNTNTGQAEDSWHWRHFEVDDKNQGIPGSSRKQPEGEHGYDRYDLALGAAEQDVKSRKEHLWWRKPGE